MRREIYQRGSIKILAILIAGFLLVTCLVLVFAQKGRIGAPLERPRRVSAIDSDSTIVVKAGGNLQAALNSAQPGDTIALEAGAVFTGPITLPKKKGNGWITIQSSKLSQLPANRRVTPADAKFMPKIVSPGNNQAAIRTEPGAHHYRILGIETTIINDTALSRQLIRLGAADATQTPQTPRENIANNILIDRSYIHSLPNSQSVCVGVALNSYSSQITNSYIAEFHCDQTDSQAVFAFNSPGDLQITNNYLEAASECIMFGYGDAGGFVPDGVLMTRNTVSKPLSWRGRIGNVKNHLEIKGGTNIRIEGNLFENNWADGQNGNAIVFTAYGNEISNVQFINNIVRISGSGITISENRSTPLSHHITIRNNLFQHIAASAFGGEGVFLKIASVPHVVVDHNTIIHDGTIIQAFGDDPKSPDGRLKIKNFAYTNNIAAHNQYGIFSSAGYGNLTISAYFPGSTFARNVIAARWVDPSLYPGNNFYPSSLDGVGFINRGAGNYRLAANSGYKGRATDGKDIGCDFDALEAAMSGTSDLSASTQR